MVVQRKPGNFVILPQEVYLWVRQNRMTSSDATRSVTSVGHGYHVGVHSPHALKLAAFGLFLRSATSHVCRHPIPTVSEPSLSSSYLFSPGRPKKNVTTKRRTSEGTWRVNARRLQSSSAAASAFGLASREIATSGGHEAAQGGREEGESC